MLEGRAIIDSVEKTKILIENLGGQFKGNYIFTDIIFLKKGKFSKDFVRVRVYIKSNRMTKKAILVRKEAEWKDIGKVDNVVLRKEFDTENDAFNFIRENLSEFKKGFEYSREGWEYELDTCRVFIEKIERYIPTIEVEASNKKDLQNFFQKIGVKKVLRESIPEIMFEFLKDPCIN